MGKGYYRQDWQYKTKKGGGWRGACGRNGWVCDGAHTLHLPSCFFTVEVAKEVFGDLLLSLYKTHANRLESETPEKLSTAQLQSTQADK